MAVAEVCRNVVCAGGEPVGLTDCLNFGSPERPEIMDQLAKAIDGMADACRALSVPIVSGNVSLYNETDGRAIYPTPILGCVGVVEKRSDVTASAFSGDLAIVLVGSETAGPLGGSEYVVRKTGAVKGPLPRIDLDLERRLQALILGLLRDPSRPVKSAQDVSEGGLAVTLAAYQLAPRWRRAPLLAAAYEAHTALLQRSHGGRERLSATLRLLEGQRRAEAPWMSPGLYVFVADAPLRRRPITPAVD